MIDEQRKYREYYETAERTSEQRRKDLVQAFDEIAALQRKVRRLHVVNTTLTAIITVLAWKGLEFLLQALQ